MSKLRKRKELYDWESVVNRFMADLDALRKHIIEHDLIADAEEIANEIETAIQLMEKAIKNDREGWPPDDKDWNTAWDYIRDNIRGWWD